MRMGVPTVPISVDGGVTPHVIDSVSVIVVIDASIHVWDIA